MRLVGLGVAVAAVLALTSPASAGEVFAGLATHNAAIHIAKCCYEAGGDVQFGARTEPFAHLLGGELRAHAIGSVNTAGGIDFGAAGLDLRFRLGDRFYIQPGLGGAIHDGRPDKYQRTLDRIYFGSRLLFEPELSLGWRISPKWAAELSYTHLSHAQLGGSHNPGMDDLGARIVYRFGR
jgi:lipid A 3-O-deacylase